MSSSTKHSGVEDARKALRILSLATRSFPTAGYLKLLEKLQSTVGDLSTHFGFFAGCSWGGVIILSILAGKTIEEIYDFLVKLNVSFTDSLGWLHDEDLILQPLKTFFGEKLLSSAKKAGLVLLHAPSSAWGSKGPSVIRTYGKAPDFEEQGETYTHIQARDPLVETFWEAARACLSFPGNKLQFSCRGSTFSDPTVFASFTTDVAVQESIIHLTPEYIAEVVSVSDRAPEYVDLNRTFWILAATKHRNNAEKSYAAKHATKICLLHPGMEEIPMKDQLGKLKNE